MLFTIFALYTLISPSYAHNWMFSPSRGSGIVQPAPPKPLRKVSHTQVARGQEFALEWSTGHPGTWYYFVVMKAEDEGLMGLHSAGNTETKLDEYLSSAAPNQLLHENEKAYRRIHVEFGYGPEGTNSDPNWGNMQPTGLPETTIDPNYVGPNDDHYLRKLYPGDPLYFDRPDTWNSADYQNHPRQQQFAYKDSELAGDLAAAYTNPKWPHIIAVYRFGVTAAPGAAHFWDVGRFNLNVEPGEYLIHMLWGGYRDVIDVDVLQGAVVSDVYGTAGSAVWVKQEHCQYPNVQMVNQFAGCFIYDGDEDPDAEQCVMHYGNQGFSAANVVPVFNPTCKIYDNQDQCEIFKCVWNSVTETCGPNMQSKYTFGWTKFFARGHLGTVDMNPEELNRRIAASEHSIVRVKRLRKWEGASTENYELYYKRIAPGSYDYTEIYRNADGSNSWVINSQNQLNVHFEIYANLVDLLEGRNRWNVCDFGSYREFPGTCGKYVSSDGRIAETGSVEMAFLETLVENDIVELYKNKNDGRRSSCKSDYVKHKFWEGERYFCGKQSEDGCWCDTECKIRGDCCDDYEDFCDGTPIGHQCDPSLDECNANAFCGDNYGRKYCMEICERQQGPHGDEQNTEFRDRTSNPHCLYSHNWLPYDVEGNERKDYNYLGCFSHITSKSYLYGWESAVKQTAWQPRDCFLECKGRGFRYMGIVGESICYCGNEYADDIQISDGDCNTCINNDRGELCGGAGPMGLWELTQCPRSHTVFGVTSPYVSYNVCWASEEAVGIGSNCDNWCVPPEHLSDPKVRQLLSMCPNNVCHWFREQHAIGDHVNTMLTEGACDRSLLRDFISEGKENVMMCAGFVPIDPIGYFNLEAEDQFVLVDDDPEDPVYYSACFRVQPTREFTNGFNSKVSEPEIDWAVGEKCVSCDAMDDIKTAASGIFTVPWWTTTNICQECE